MVPTNSQKKEYLTNGGLLNILRQNESGGKE